MASETYAGEEYVQEQAFRAIKDVYGSDQWLVAPSGSKQLQEQRVISTLFDTPQYDHSTWEAEVLCNLSKGEYVRANGLENDEITLTHALLSQICWSDDSSVAMMLDDESRKELVHGPWTGDRFCITTLEDMPKEYRRTEWKDVTERVATFVQHLDKACRQW